MSSINSLGGSSAWAAAGTQRADRPPGGPDPSRFKQDLFDKLDGNASGGVDSAELDKLLTEVAQRGGGSTAGKPADAFSRMDSNGDGSLAVDELDSGLKKLLGGPSDTVSFARTRGAGGPPSGPPPGPPPAAAAVASSADSSAATDPLDTDGDGTVSASERAAGDIKQALQDLLKAADTDGDQAINGRELRQLTEVLKQLGSSAGSRSGSSSTSAGQGADTDRAASVGALADQVMRHYAQASANERSGGLSLAA